MKKLFVLMLGLFGFLALTSCSSECKTTAKDFACVQKSCQHLAPDYAVAPVGDGEETETEYNPSRQDNEAPPSVDRLYCLL